jgi:hypothetical protein
MAVIDIKTYDGLLSGVAEYLNRADLTDIIPTFVTLAHSKLNLELRVREMQTRADASTPDEYVQVPADFEAPYSMELASEPDCWGEPLVFVTEDKAKQLRNSGATGSTKWYTIFGDAFELIPAPTTDTAFRLKYFASIPALSADTQTNWLLTKAPGAYLYGSLLEAAPYLKNDERIVTWETARQQVIDLLKLASERALKPQAALVATRRTFG